MFNSKSTVVLALVACAVQGALAQINPTTIALGTTVTDIKLNASMSFSYPVPANKISDFNQYFFKVQVAPGGFAVNSNYVLQAYWFITVGTNPAAWVAITPSSWFQLSTDAVATSGFIAISIDPKTLYEKYQAITPRPNTLSIAFQLTCPQCISLVANSLYSVTLTEVIALKALDGSGHIGQNGNDGMAFAGTCPGSYTRCQVVVAMQYHNHQYLEAAVTRTSGTFYSATMRNAAFFSVDNTKYFADSTTGIVYPRTCALTNTSCEIENDYYYVDVRTGFTQVSDSGYSMAFTTKAGAHATASVSALTLVMLGAVAFFTSRQ